MATNNPHESEKRFVCHLMGEVKIDAVKQELLLRVVIQIRPCFQLIVELIIL